ncbi:pirin family protein [Flagellimonas aequoris]|uniref:Pirin family protein n=1 Tax=Flagellimonas aequoris TaxID=2306997 RepID=A0A418N4V4_9FLAO|nr:pirin family protein [Allomuricauda aequoris]RIV68930.1 pirin family protein [Allomuricauda aequoris]TXK00637.1 pirin family protein [Allomuricauda aequoris]
MSNPILQAFPLSMPWQTQDPFLFSVYHLDHYPKGNGEMGPDPELLGGRSLGNDFNPYEKWRMYHGQTIPGFPYHPHRGFETITIVNKGFCDHSDSLGAAGRFGEGDVQWMTAGRGVQHSEMFPLLNDDGDNPLELFQIWLNLPKASKFVEPHFKMLWNEDVPIVTEGKATIKVVAGNYKSTEAIAPAPDSWAADPNNEVAIWNIHVDANSEYILPKVGSKVNRTLYFYEGDTIQIEGKNINSKFGIALDPLQDVHITIGAKNAHFILLQGKPINEPVAKYGPFVMNTEEEIQQAMEEYRLTQFGGWPWPYPDHVHDKEKGRFALYPDGSLVKK